MPEYDFNFNLTATDYYKELVRRHPKYRTEYLFMDDLQMYVKASHKKDKDFEEDWGNFMEEATEEYKLPEVYAFKKNPDEWLASSKDVFRQRWKIPFDVRTPFPWRADDPIGEGKDVSPEALKGRASSEVITHELIKVPNEFDGKDRDAFIKQVEAAVLRGAGFLVACYPACTSEDLETIKVPNEWPKHDQLSERYPNKGAKRKIFRDIEIYDFVMWFKDDLSPTKVSDLREYASTLLGSEDYAVDSEQIEVDVSTDKVLQHLAEVFAPDDSEGRAYERIRKAYQRISKLIKESGPQD